MIAAIQLDGLGTEPLARLLADGAMPNLAAALERTPPSPIETPARQFPAAVYPSLYTGLEPSEHGLFYPFQWDPTEQRVVLADRLPRPPTIWERLDDRGARCLVIDPYECAPGPARGARVISGWQLSERVVLRRWSRPVSLWPSAALRMGLPPRATEVFGEHTRGETSALARGLERSPGRVAELAERELAGGCFDLAWISFIASHLAGHRLWGTTGLDAVYRATDAGLGRVLAALPAGARTVLVCPIGMSADETGSDLLGEMLARVLGTAVESAPAAGDSGAIWRLRSAVPPGLRRTVSLAMPAPLARRLTARLELRGIDWSRTRAFAHPSDNQGYVRLNLAGREREGIVDPADAEELRAEIAAGLASFRRPSGAAAIESVEPTEASGERAGRLPDLVVRWDRNGEGLGELRSERFGSVVRRGVGSGRTGNHPDDGAWVAAEIAPQGRRIAQLTDLAATIAAEAGIDPPRSAGGSAAADPEPLVIR